MGYNYRKGMPDPHIGINDTQPPKKSVAPAPQGDGHAEAEDNAALQKILYYGAEASRKSNEEAKTGVLEVNKRAALTKASNDALAKRDSVVKASGVFNTNKKP